MMRISCAISMALAISGPAVAGPAGMPMENPYGTKPVDRPVMVNPYESVEQVRKQKMQSLNHAKVQIRALYEASARRVQDPGATLQDHLSRIRKEAVSDSDMIELMNLDNDRVETDPTPAARNRAAWSIPSLSDIGSGRGDPVHDDEFDAIPTNVFLDGWELVRMDDGTPIARKIGDSQSGIAVRVGMVMGEFGRVVAVRDTSDAFFIVLESGDRIEGIPDHENDTLDREKG